jgi:signal transduction histidine kinase
VQEAVRNAEEHANATEVSVNIVLSGDSVVVEVTDDGMGFDTATLGRRQAAGRMGLRLLDDLAHEHGAVVGLDTKPGAGTTLRLEMPA